MKTIAMIPARLGSQRLKQKNLREIDGAPIIAWAIRRCKAAGIFDEIWVNSEADVFAEIAEREGVSFHRRPAELANNVATSEQFVHEFLTRHNCAWLVQVHSIAPLLTSDQIRGFVEAMVAGDFDAMMSCTLEQIECAIDGRPINFSFDAKTNSQELVPVQRISWSITGWKAVSYQNAFDAGKCATYAGRVGFYPIDRLAGLIIKTESDLEEAQALWPLRMK
ncbi:MAG: cytidyltransferase [Candidatus Sumerlaeia bacterium]